MDGKVFGEIITNAEGKQISIYDIGIQHVTEDVGFVPTVDDWFEHFNEEEWQNFRKKRVEERFTKNKPGEKIPQVMKELLQGGNV